MDGDIDSLHMMDPAAGNKDFYCTVATASGTDGDTEFGDGTVLGGTTVGVDACDRTAEGELKARVDGGNRTRDDLEGADGVVKGFVKVGHCVDCVSPGLDSVVPPGRAQCMLIR